MKTLVRLSIGFALALSFVPFVTSAEAIPPTVNVTDNCTVVDTDGASHVYNQAGQFLGICALAAAKDQAAVNAYTLQNFSFGLFLQSLNGITPGATQFWDLYQNGIEASVGLSDLTVATGDILKFQLTDFTDHSEIGTPVIFQIKTLSAPASAPSPSGGGGGLNLHAPFDVPLASTFISSTQNADGSFDSMLLSDWVAIALATGGAGDAKQKLSEYFIANEPVLVSITDFERHAMALLALGINPYNGTSIDYITPIISSFDGTQIGDSSLVNDDIFAIFPLLYAGYSSSDEVIRKISAFIISKQSTNGSWENSVDMTAAAIQALSLVRELPGAPSAISIAANYLHAEQRDDGSFGNSFSTSWALQAIASLFDSQLNWARGYRTPQYYLATLQQADGGVDSASTSMSTRVWATAYAIPAIKGKTWSSLLSSFERPVTPQEPTQTATTSPATSTVISIAETVLLDVAKEVKEQKIPPLPTADTEATTTPEHVTPQVVQTASAATAYNEISDLWKLVTLVLLSLSVLSLLALQNRFRK